MKHLRSFSPEERVASHLDPDVWINHPQKWIYVNRDLRLDKIQAVGFDMDFTLAIYKGSEFLSLTYYATLERLVSKEGYPEEILQFQYQPGEMIRGLVMDKTLGTLFKLDCHHYVGRVMRFGKMLDKKERRKLYGNKKIYLGSENYRWLDTLFELPEAHLYMQMVTYFSTHPKRKDFPCERIFADVRKNMDDSHKDWRVKGKIPKDPERFLELDPLLSSTLHRFRSAGKKLFLLTNSNWEYTQAVMDILLPPGELGYKSWMHFFDLIVVSAEKPSFFRHEKPFGKPEKLSSLPPDRAKIIWQGGNIGDLQRFLGVSGDEILYIGDNLYGDILRSQKDGLWRTCMIIPELEEEIAKSVAHRELFYELWDLEQERRQIDSELNFHRIILWKLDHHKGKNTKKLFEECKRHLSSLQKKLEHCVKNIQALQQQIDSIFNPNWGLLMREDHEKSLFGEQVETYAGLYTSRVSNFCFYSPLQYFRASLDRMPHELVI